MNGEGTDKTGTAHPNPQKWTTLDLGGMGLKNISGDLFRYNFLTALYVNHNNLQHLSPDVCHLRNLTILDASGNKLTSIPPELGMLTNLKELLLVDNGLMTLPAEMGTLFQLEILALEGNPLNESLKSLLQQEGTEAVINYLRENCTGNERCFLNRAHGSKKKCVRFSWKGMKIGAPTFDSFLFLNLSFC